MIQIDVASHFNEDAYSHGLAIGLADRLRAELKDFRCPNCDREGSIRISTQGLAQTINEISVEVDGCCSAMTKEVERIVAEVRTRD